MTGFQLIDQKYRCCEKDSAFFFFFEMEASIIDQLLISNFDKNPSIIDAQNMESNILDMVL